MIKKKISSKQIKDFLRDNPNYFIDNPQLLDNMNFPVIENADDKNSKVISFKDWIISALKLKQKKIINNAHFNFKTQKKIHSVIIEMIKMPSFQSVFDYFKNNLPEKFDIDCALIVSSSKEVERFGGIIIAPEKIELLTKNKKTIIMDAVDDEMGIFKSLSYKVKSNALFAIDESIFNAPCILAFGSKKNIFINNKGYDLIFFFSQVLEEHFKQIKKNEWTKYKSI